MHRWQQANCSQWLNCKNRSGERPPPPLPPSLSLVPFLPFFPLPSSAAKRPPKTSSGVLGSAISSPVGFAAKPRPQTQFGVFWAGKSHLAATYFVIYLSLKWCILKHETTDQRRSGFFKKVAECRSGAFRLSLSSECVKKSLTRAVCHREGRTNTIPLLRWWHVAT